MVDTAAATPARVREAIAVLEAFLEAQPYTPKREKTASKTLIDHAENTLSE